MTGLMITDEEMQLCQTRSNRIDPAHAKKLYHIGSYRRALPVSIDRMIENAYDWEHLPFVHPSSFSDILCVESGSWGWRAKVELPPLGSKRYQLIELLVDHSRRYWATSILDGSGIEIHTQATGKAAPELKTHGMEPREIEIDVRFYLPGAPDDEGQEAFILKYMRTQYAMLYDEDEALMSSRQKALDNQKGRSGAGGASDGFGDIYVGEIQNMDPQKSYIIDTPSGAFAVRFWQGAWRTYSATCPHLLGPLQDARIDNRGIIQCPWHGYEFDIQTGQNIGGNCGPLSNKARLLEKNGVFYLASQQSP